MVHLMALGPDFAALFVAFFVPRGDFLVLLWRRRRGSILYFCPLMARLTLLCKIHYREHDVYEVKNQSLHVQLDALLPLLRVRLCLRGRASEDDGANLPPVAPAKPGNAVLEAQVLVFCPSSSDGSGREARTDNVLLCWLGRRLCLRTRGLAWLGISQ